MGVCARGKVVSARRMSVVVAVCGLGAGLASADGDDRAFDGWGNNIDHPDWGAAASNLMRMMGADYADDASAMSGANRPSARAVSNAFHHGREPRWSRRVLTSMVFSWGQFIDHDIDLTPAASGEAAPIPIPADDPWMTPGGEIPFTRSIYDPATGAAPGNPRQQINEITSFIDASMVYGSSEGRAMALRAFTGGRLIEGADGLLPWNTLGVFMDDPFGRPPEQLFAAGDIRANEQPGLTALHTLFVREHNRLADFYDRQYPHWTDEEVFQKAREINWAQIQAITYYEFLPALLGDGVIPEYQGYDPLANPGVATEFSAGAYRFGHSMVNPTLPRFMSDGSAHPGGPLDLFESFFNPGAILDSGGIEPIIRGQIRELSQEIDPFIVDDLRNLLFGGGGIGLDLASLNIQRGRDHGVPAYNDVRESFGLGRAEDWSQITSNADIQQRLSSVYDSPDDVDLWIGALCEDHAPGAGLGQTLTAVIADQFIRLRDGDRYYFERHLTPNEISTIRSTTLGDVIRRNTSAGYVQDNVFFVSADMNEDAVIDYADVMAFLVAFSTQQPAANFVPDVVFDINDVLAFVIAFDRYYSS